MVRFSGGRLENQAIFMAIVKEPEFRLKKAGRMMVFPYPPNGG
jgi:hypothetical protein